MRAGSACRSTDTSGQRGEHIGIAAVARPPLEALIHHRLIALAGVLDANASQYLQLGLCILRQDVFARDVGVRVGDAAPPFRRGMEAEHSIIDVGEHLRLVVQQVGRKDVHRDVAVLVVT